MTLTLADGATRSYRTFDGPLYVNQARPYNVRQVIKPFHLLYQHRVHGLSVAGRIFLLHEYDVEWRRKSVENVRDEQHDQLFGRRARSLARNLHVLESTQQRRATESAKRNTPAVIDRFIRHTRIIRRRRVIRSFPKGIIITFAYLSTEYGRKKGLGLLLFLDQIRVIVHAEYVRVGDQRQFLNVIDEFLVLGQMRAIVRAYDTRTSVNVTRARNGGIFR